MDKLLKYLTKLEELEGGGNEEKKQLYISKINYYYNLVGGKPHFLKSLVKAFKIIKLNRIYYILPQNIMNNEGKNLALFYKLKNLSKDFLEAYKEICGIPPLNNSLHTQNLEKNTCNCDTSSKKEDGSSFPMTLNPVYIESKSPLSTNNLIYPNENVNFTKNVLS
jgi:hypothetical protein